jgi:nitrate reductase beta subunit
MLHLPRLCNHCLLPSCAVACRSKAIYKRSGDGIVLVDQEKCRGRRSCVTACPYKKVYVNRVTERAEKCMFCLPGVVENGLAPLCAETCVGRIRSIGVVLYDAEAVARVAEETPADDLVEAQRRLLLDPEDDSVRARAEADGVPHQWLEAARRSPVYALAKELRVALPLHPEFRTLPMVWYVPPLSPVVESLRTTRAPSVGIGDPIGPQGVAAGPVFGAAETLRIPLDYLAELFAAGERAPVEEAVDSLIAMREFKRRQQIHGDDAARASTEATWAGVDPSRLERLYRLLAIAERKERFAIPTARHEDGTAQTSSTRSSLQKRGDIGEET